MQKKKILLSFLIISGILAIAIFTLTSSYYAQITTPEQAIEISPPSQELDVDPGETVQFTTIVRNNGNVSYPLNVRIEDFTASGDAGQVSLIEDGPWSIASWATIEPSEFSLDPKDEQKVTITLNVPKQDIGGGKYGAVVFSRKGEGSENATSVSQEIASLFLLRISGPVNEHIKILNFTAPSFVEFGPVPFEMNFENTGNVHVKVTGIISVMNVLGKKVDDIIIPPTNVFPKAKRIVTSTLDNIFLIGPYQAVAIIYYGTDNKSITTYTPFFAFPVRIVAAVFFVIFVLFILRKRIRKAFKALTAKS